MAEENMSNSLLSFVLVFMLGFFFSKLMPDICRSMDKAGIIDVVANPSNGIIQGFNVGGQNNQGTNQPTTRSTSSCGR